MSKKQIADIPTMPINRTRLYLDTVWGAYPDSNRRKQLHKLLCYHYTIGTASLIYTKKRADATGISATALSLQL